MATNGVMPDSRAEVNGIAEDLISRILRNAGVRPDRTIVVAAIEHVRDIAGRAILEEGHRDDLYKFVLLRMKGSDQQELAVELTTWAAHHSAVAEPDGESTQRMSHLRM